MSLAEKMSLVKETEELKKQISEISIRVSETISQMIRDLRSSASTEFKAFFEKAGFNVVESKEDKIQEQSKVPYSADTLTAVYMTLEYKLEIIDENAPFMGAASGMMDLMLSNGKKIAISIDVNEKRDNFSSRSEPQDEIGKLKVLLQREKDSLERFKLRESNLPHLKPVYWTVANRKSYSSFKELLEEYAN
ncbi:hypothetical protein BBD42_21545 [Paenibacillus sp. BIHB 4019]|uniref:Uncharacterized protein n=1 Tax=Paenibacillus sp. BIHB 4019 TaxID=1870819 RepID=A0A1B2DM34_9BACL|nr:hypothetical protein [Paenibacillus sp. BIHB 4019]ANY68761.1 hypothetical protein BBD42_21545 [Paenibacillus sp. BIHB 4019]